MIRYSIIIVNYKTPQLVIDCINSFWHACDPVITEVIVVDNESADGSQNLIRSAHPFIRWIDMGYNSGFARANNAGIRASKGSLVLLLNSDTLDETAAIRRCFERFETATYIACGVQLLNIDHTPQIAGNYVLRGGLNYLMALPYLGRLIRNTAVLAGVKKTNIAHTTTTVEVDWINGAFLMVKKSAIEKAGYLDEDFFLYAEESEWCSRLKKQGKLCIYGDLNIIHLEGGSSGTAYNSQTRGYQNLSDKKGFQILISNFVRFRKEFGVFWYLFHLSAHLFTVVFSAIVVLVKSLTGQNKPEITAWKGYAGNVFKSLRFFFNIVSNKPTFYKVL